MGDAADPPMLAYATPGATPPGSAFTVSGGAGFVRVERPLPGRPIERAVLVVAMVIAVATAAMVVAQAAAHPWPGVVLPGRAAAAAAAVLTAFAGYVLLMLPTTWPRRQVLTLAGVELTVLNGDGAPANRPRRYRVTAGFGWSLPTPDVARMRLIADLFARAGYRRPVLIRRLPEAECRWVAGVLQSAFDGRSQPPESA